MPKTVLEDLRLQVEASTAVEASAVLLINGIAARQEAAIKKALENGATAEELAPLTEEVAHLKASGDALSAAILANTPQE